MARALERLAQTVLTIIAALTIVFVILRLTPGDPVQIILGDYATPQLTATIKRQYGLDKPIPVQYLIFLKNSATGNFGQSLFLKTNVASLIRSTLPWTIQLAVAGMIVTCIIGIPLGVIAALKRNSIADYASMLIALLGVSMPSFLLALLMIYVLSYKYSFFPVQGAGEKGDFLGQLHHLILPAVALGFQSAALVARTTRSSLLAVLGEDYVRTARAKGLRDFSVTRAHVFRNALVPILAVLGIYFGQLLGGSAVIEIVFGRPGLGKLLVDSIRQRDYPLSQALIAVFLFAVIIVNFVTDMLYTLADPRLRSE